MEISSAMLLGLVQGLTEFIPISSSGHLIMAREFFDLPLLDSLTFDIFLHMATLLAVIIYFRRDIWALLVSALHFVIGTLRDTKQKNLLWAIIIGTIPAAAVGYYAEPIIESGLRNITVVFWALIAGSILFWVAEHYFKFKTGGKPANVEELTIKKGILIGFFQALALIPGISRSGATISGGLLLGMDRVEATRFSFLLSIPIILGSGTKKIIDIVGAETVSATAWGPTIMGSIVAFVVGLISIHLLLKFLRNHTLHLFATYRIIAAIFIFIFLI